jgi:hypothetical protein
LDARYCAVFHDWSATFCGAFALISQIQFPDFQPFAALNLDSSWLQKTTLFFTNSPITLFIGVCGCYFYR